MSATIQASLEITSDTHGRAYYRATVRHDDGTVYQTPRRYKSAVAAINAAVRHEWADPVERARALEGTRIEW